ncbi:MAG: ankyrin repeat domain-containing protein [Elusimicrobia bacterium]|nr:ankyrin repeat domain-containing protein [Elusimicrobiota bacterium]
MKKFVLAFLVGAANFSTQIVAQVPTREPEVIEVSPIAVQGQNNEERRFVKNWAIFEAISKANVDGVKKALKDGIDVNFRDKGLGSNGTPLYVRNENETPILMAAAFYAAARRHRNTSPESLQAIKNLRDIVDVLLGNKADVKAADDYGNTVLMWAAYGGDTKLIERLVDEGADVNAVAQGGWKRNSREGFTAGGTPLLRAITANSAKAANALLEKKADINLKDKDGRDPLLWVLEQIELSRAPDFSVLIATLAARNPATINDFDANGDPAVVRQAASGRTGIVRGLLAASNINVNRKGKNGNTALIEAAKRGYFEIVELLAQREGIAVNELDSKGNTALFWAVRANSPASVKALKKARGVDPNIRAEGRRTSLHEAVSRNFNKVVDELLGFANMEANLVEENLKTALVIAAEQGNTEIVKTLLKREDLNVNVRDLRGRTALIAAVQAGSFETALALLEHPQIDVEAADFDGKSASDYALENKLDATLGRIIRKKKEEPKAPAAPGDDASPAQLIPVLRQLNDLMARPPRKKFNTVKASPVEPPKLDKDGKPMKPEVKYNPFRLKQMFDYYEIRSTQRFIARSFFEEKKAGQAQADPNRGYQNPSAEFSSPSSIPLFVGFVVGENYSGPLTAQAYPVMFGVYLLNPVQSDQIQMGGSQASNALQQLSSQELVAFAIDGIRYFYLEGSQDEEEQKLKDQYADEIDRIVATEYELVFLKSAMGNESRIKFDFEQVLLNLGANKGEDRIASKPPWFITQKIDQRTLEAMKSRYEIKALVDLNNDGRQELIYYRAEPEPMETRLDYKGKMEPSFKWNWLYLGYEVQDGHAGKSRIHINHDNDRTYCGAYPIPAWWHEPYLEDLGSRVLVLRGLADEEYKSVQSVVLFVNLDGSSDAAFVLGIETTYPDWIIKTKAAKLDAKATARLIDSSASREDLSGLVRRSETIPTFIIDPDSKRNR